MRKWSCSSNFDHARASLVPLFITLIIESVSFTVVFFKIWQSDGEAKFYPLMISRRHVVQLTYLGDEPAGFDASAWWV